MAVLGVFIVLGILLVEFLVLGLSAFAVNEINTALMSVNESVGAVDFQDAVSKTWGYLNDGLINSLNWLAFAIFFGLFVGMVVVGYFYRHEQPVLFFVLDIFLLFIAFITAGYISDAYEILIGIDTFQNIFVDNMNIAAKLMLDLPIWVAVMGALMMIVTYIGIPRSTEEQVAGF